MRHLVKLHFRGLLKSSSPVPGAQALYEGAFDSPDKVNCFLLAPQDALVCVQCLIDPTLDVLPVIFAWQYKQRKEFSYSVLCYKRREESYVIQHQANDPGRNLLQPVLEDDILRQRVRGDQQIALFRELDSDDVGIQFSAASFRCFPEVALPGTRGRVVFRQMDGFCTTLRAGNEIERAAYSAVPMKGDGKEVLHLQQDRFVQVGDALSKGLKVRQQACKILVPREDPDQG